MRIRRVSLMCRAHYTFSLDISHGRDERNDIYRVLQEQINSDRATKLSLWWFWLLPPGTHHCSHPLALLSSCDAMDNLQPIIQKRALPGLVCRWAVPRHLLPERHFIVECGVRNYTVRFCGHCARAMTLVAWICRAFHREAASPRCPGLIWTLVWDSHVHRLNGGYQCSMHSSWNIYPIVQRHLTECKSDGVHCNLPYIKHVLDTSCQGSGSHRKK